MPRREEIERFAQVLDALGGEPAVRAAKAQTIEAATPADEMRTTPPAAEEALSWIR